MSRQLPKRARPSPASQRPEGKADEKLVESSRALQSRMREKATSHATPSAEPSAEPEGTTTVQTEEVEVKQESTAEPVAPKVSQSKPAKKRTVKPASVSKPEARVGGETERYSLRVPFNLEMQNAIAAMAKSYGKDAEYVASALLKQSKADLRNTWEAGDLKSLEASAKLISEQSDQQGTHAQIFKATAPTKLVEDARKLFDDPLGLITDNKILAAFVAASIYEKLKKA